MTSAVITHRFVARLPVLVQPVFIAAQFCWRRIRIHPRNEASPPKKIRSPTASAPAAAPPDSGTTTAERTVYEISRLRSFDDERLPAALIIAGAIALVAVVWQLYRRDAVELARGTASASCCSAASRSRPIRVLPGHRTAYHARNRSQLASCRTGRCQPKHGLQ